MTLWGGLVLFTLLAVTPAFAQTEQHGDIYRSGTAFVSKQAVSDSTYTLIWGTGDARRELGRSFHNSVHFELSASSRSFAALEATCGTACWFGVVLPFGETARPVVRSYPIAYDLESGLAGYIGSGDTLAYVIDLRRDVIKGSVLKGECPFSFNGDCISEAKFEKNGLRVRWRDMPEGEPREDTILIKPRM